MRIRRFALVEVLMTLAVAAAGAQTSKSVARSQPLQFEPNAGQFVPGQDYVARAANYRVGVHATGLVLLPASKDGKLVTMEFGGASAAKATPAEREPGVVNYLIGDDRSKWRRDVPVYGRVSYARIYAGVDVTYYGKGRNVEYDLRLAAGTDPALVTMRVAGSVPTLSQDGDLDLGQGFVLQRPVAYQEVAGKRIAVESHFVLRGATIRFAVGRYDRSLPLVLDPVLTFYSYFGGTGYDYIGGNIDAAMNSQGVAVDSAFNLYVTGSTTSPNFPTKNPAGTAPTKNDSRYSSAYITKFNASGALVYSTYLGGVNDDISYAIAVDSAGEPYIAGTTNSPDFPITTNAYQSVCAPALNNSSQVVGNCNNGNTNVLWRS